MSDITMCTNNKCILKNLCYRHTAIPDNEHQSYSDFNMNGNKACEHFVKNNKEFIIHDRKIIPADNIHSVSDLLKLFGVTMEEEK